MVKPIYLQDNFSKTLIAQRMADEEHMGQEKMRARDQQIAQRELEEKERRLTRELIEKPGTKALDPKSGGRRHATLKKGKKKKDGDPDEEEMEEEKNDLRLRRDEDDEGKGSRLDIEG